VHANRETTISLPNFEQCSAMQCSAMSPSPFPDYLRQAVLGQRVHIPSELVGNLETDVLLLKEYVHLAIALHCIAFLLVSKLTRRRFPFSSAGPLVVSLSVQRGCRRFSFRYSMAAGGFPFGSARPPPVFPFGTACARCP
jgi:hypothetical protein